MINIQPKTVSGQTATKLDIRLIRYPLSGTDFEIYYSYFTESNAFIADGNISLTGSYFASGTNTALAAALTSAVGSHTNPKLEMWDIGNSEYNFSYTKDGDNAWRKVSGVIVPSNEASSLKANILTVLAVTETGYVTVLVAENVAYTWFGRPSTAGADGKQWIGYTKDITGGTFQHILQYNEVTDTYTEHRVGYYHEKDDHNNPSILVRDDGRLLIAYNEHASYNLRTRISGTPYDAATFGSETSMMPNGTGHRYTYATLYKISNGDIMFLYRLYRISDPVPTFSWYYMRSTNQGGTWSAPTQLQNMGGVQAYIVTAQSDTNPDIIHFVATDRHPQTGAPTPASEYHYYFDFGSNTIHKSDGTDITHLLPIGIGDATVVALMTYPDSSWMDDIIVHEGKPRILFTKYPGGAENNMQFKDLYYTEWTGSAWTTPHFIVRSLDGYIERDSVIDQTAYVPNARFDVNNPNLIWASIEVSGYLEIHKVTRNSSTSFTLEQITFNSTKDNWRPITVLGTKNTTLWMRNNLYSMYTVYDMDLIALKNSSV